MSVVRLASGAALLLQSGAPVGLVPTVPTGESYLSATNANTAAFSYLSAASSRDQEVTFTRNYVGRIFLRKTTDGRAIMFDFSGAAFNIYLASGVTESAYAPTVTKTLHTHGAALSGTIKVGVSGFDIYVVDDGVEVVRFKSIHIVEAGKVATKEGLGATRSAGTVTFLANANLYSPLSAGIYDPRDFGARALQTTGSITASSSTLQVANPTGFVVGDFVIVETGTESGAGARGTKGVGGTWPSLSYANAAARTADSSQAEGKFAWQEDTGEQWRWVSGAWTQPYSTSYYLAKAHPRALQARITAISGNDLTLSTPAGATATNANVYLDNTPFLNLMTYNIWYKFGSPAGDLRSFLPSRARIRIPAGTWGFGGKIYLGQFAQGMTIEGVGDTTILKSPKGCPSISILVTDHDPTEERVVVKNLKMVGNVRDVGFGMDYANTSWKPSGSGGSGFEWDTDTANLSETTVSTGAGYSPGVLMTGCTNCVVSGITSVDVWQKSIGANQSTDCWARNSTTTMTDGLRAYIQWFYQWADCTRGGIEDCTVTSPRLIAGAEVFRSDGSVITRFTGNNASMSSNSAGNFVFTDCTINITVTDNVEATSGFSTSNPLVNINSNIQPPSGAVAQGGSIVNCVMAQSAYIDANNNSLKGIDVNAYNPNITITGGSYSAPDYASPSTLYGACGILSTGSNTQVEDFTVVGKARHETAPVSFRNIHLAGGGGSAATNCVANQIYVA